MSTSPLWITYSWVDDAEGDFSYLVQELKTVGVDATYDRVALIPGHRLWEQIGDRILNSPLSGWAYLLTPMSLDSQACREELEYALNRALEAKSADFPLLGLLHQVPIKVVPPALRVRLCVSLDSPDWKEEVLAALQGRPPKREAKTQSAYVWKIHKAYGSNPAHTAVEVRPRFGQLSRWRIAVPSSCSVAAYGYGPSNGGALGSIQEEAVEGELEINGTTCQMVGCGNALSPSTSAYLVFEGQAPAFVFFGQATEPYGMSAKGEFRRFPELSGSS